MGFMLGLALLMAALLCLLEWVPNSLTASGMPDLHLQMHAGELRLAASATGKLVSEGDTRLRQMGIWTVDLGGVDCHRTAAREGLLQPGSTVSLMREPVDGPGSNAIAVHAAAGRPVGYLNEGMAVALSKLLDGGATFHAISLSFDSSGARAETGVVKVLAASPEIVRHLLRRQPNLVLDLAS
jgi:hypothetical protein